jgi:hypothetical protein
VLDGPICLGNRRQDDVAPSHGLGA